MAPIMANQYLFIPGILKDCFGCEHLGGWGASKDCEGSGGRKVVKGVEVIKIVKGYKGF